jgi:hypothetical protein
VIVYLFLRADEFSEISSSLNDITLHLTDKDNLRSHNYVEKINSDISSAYDTINIHRKGRTLTSP